MFFTVNRKPQPIPEKDNVQGFRVYGPVPDVGIIRRARLNCTAPAKEQTSEFLNVLFYLTTSAAWHASAGQPQAESLNLLSPSCASWIEWHHRPLARVLKLWVSKPPRPLARVLKPGISKPPRRHMGVYRNWGQVFGRIFSERSPWSAEATPIPSNWPHSHSKCRLHLESVHPK